MKLNGGMLLFTQNYRRILTISIIIFLFIPISCFGKTNYPNADLHQIWANNHGLTERVYHKKYKEIPVYSYSSVKRYEDYRCITDNSSSAYKVTRRAHAENDGSMVIRNRHVVAVGTSIGHVGEKIDFELTKKDGTTQILKCIIGDSKRTVDTKNNNNYYGKDGHVIEAIVCTEALPSTARQMGDLNYINNWNGKVTKIWKIK